MRCCVTGGAGFIGSHLTDKLCTLGHEVLVLDNLSGGNLSFVHPKAKFVEMDIRDEKVEEVFRDFGVEVVFHLAAQTMVNLSMTEPKFDADVNVLGLINVLEACRKTGVKKVITPSSAAVYGDLPTLPLEESMQVKPLSFYGLTKWMMESYLRIYAEQFGLSYACFRYSNVYGPRQGQGGEGGVISIFVKHVVQGLPLTVFGDGEQTRDFIYVDDVVAANMAALEQPETQGVFNVSTSTAVSVNELIYTLEEIAGKSCSVKYLEGREGDIRHSLLFNAKIRREYGWSPSVSLLEGLRSTYQYFLEQA